MRVGIAESVPPPRLVIGFGKDRRTVDAVQVQDETVVYRYWLKVAEGDKLVHVALAPGQAKDANLVKPAEVAANVSGDKRYGNETAVCTSTRWSCAVPSRRRPIGFPSRIGGSCLATPSYGDQSRLDCAREAIARFAGTGLPAAGADRTRWIAS